MRRPILLRLLFVALLLAGFSITQAQTTSALEYYQQARKLAFEEKNYRAARALCTQAVQRDTVFTDAYILKARLYAWEYQYDSARIILDAVLNKYPNNQDALMAAADVANWSRQYRQALHYCELALQQHPASTEWLLRKARISFAMQDYDAAKKAADELLQQDATNTEAHNLEDQLTGYTLNNRAGIGYDYYYFDKQFAQPWHIGYAEYSRLMQPGTFTARISYGNRYGLQAWQGEAEGYPRLSKSLYTYVNIGFSGNTNNVFPRFRSGLSLFASLPRSWELEGGARYLQFDDHIWIYTGSVGKYIGKYWFNARCFIAPGNNRMSQSYFLTTRYYYAKEDDYIILMGGSGVSPDENRNVQFGTSGNLSSYRISTGIHHRFGRTIVYTNLAWSRDEYYSKIYGNQFNMGIGLQRKF
jgi:YaiO family outer membrane protein